MFKISPLFKAVFIWHIEGETIANETCTVHFEAFSSRNCSMFLNLQFQTHTVKQ